MDAQQIYQVMLGLLAILSAIGAFVATRKPPPATVRTPERGSGDAHRASDSYDSHNGGGGNNDEALALLRDALANAEMLRNRVRLLELQLDECEQRELTRATTRRAGARRSTQPRKSL